MNYRQHGLKERITLENVLQAKISKAKHIVFFCGAGISVASGIPDFRSANGLFHRRFGDLTPEMMLSTSFFHLHPDLFFEFYRQHMIYPDAKPNSAHMKIAELEKRGKLSGVITQNIDGLHRSAGNKLVYELHGSIHDNYCMDCGRHYGLQRIVETQGIPRCECCGGVIKPSVVLYGEPLDHYVSTGACREISRCDMLIVAGTSLTVEPAASFLSYFRGGSREFIMINCDKNQSDARATMIIHQKAEEVLSKIHLNP